MKRMTKIFFTSLVLFISIFSFAVRVALAQDYPNKPIRLIVPVAAGGGMDTAARIITEKLSPILGQPVLVENKPGAAMRIGTEMVARAAPDGYTILMVANNHSISPSIFKKIPYDAVKDFAPIAMTVLTPNFLAVHPSSPAKSVSELVALAKSKPGKLNYGISGLGEMGHLNGELFKKMADINVMVVPFKGTAEAVTALVGGHVDFVFGGTTAIVPHIQGGTLRALAVAYKKRSPAAPDVPTMVESGFPGFVAASWFAILAPAGTPQTIITKLNTEIVKILKMPDVHERLMKNGLEPTPMTPEETADYIKSELIKWGKVIKDAGIEPQ